jgi:hypothetical protein
MLAGPPSVPRSTARPERSTTNAWNALSVPLPPAMSPRLLMAAPIDVVGSAAG